MHEQNGQISADGKDEQMFDQNEQIFGRDGHLDPFQERWNCLKRENVVSILLPTDISPILKGKFSILLIDVTLRHQQIS